MYIPAVWTFEFPQRVFKKVTQAGLDSLRQKSAKIKHDLS